MYTRKQRNEIAKAMRNARPFILDSPEDKARKTLPFLWARDTYVNCCEQLADLFATHTAGQDAEERQIFLSNCQAIEIAPFVCTQCGQHITDGKPCGHGHRAKLGIV